MKIKINANELKEVLDKHFGGIDTHYELDLIEDSFAIEVRLGKEKVLNMVEAPNYDKVAIRGVFPNMSVLLAVQDIK